MSLEALIALFGALAPEIQVLLVDLVKAFHGKDDAAARAALEAALRLQFEARQPQ
jgi:hypothetical protein